MKITQPLWMARGGRYKVEVIAVGGSKLFNVFSWDESAGKCGDWKPYIQVGSMLSLSRWINLTGVVRTYIPDYVDG